MFTQKSFKYSRIRYAYNLRENFNMTNLPTTYKKFFWDCDFGSLCMEAHKMFILKRLLAYGDLNAIKFLVNQYTQKEVKDYVTANGNNSLSRNNLYFWQKLVKHNELWTR